MIRRARRYLAALEAQRGAGDGGQVPLDFSSADETAEATASEAERNALDALAALEPDNLSPREALDRLYALKALLKD